jgi:F-type H+-transporting ATPase subunit delta
MRSSGAARRYSRALFSIARDDGSIAAVRGELDAFSQVLGDTPELRDELFRPLRPVRERRGVLAGVSERLGFSPTVRNFLTFLIDQRRLVDFEAIKDEFERLADEAAGRVQAEIISATPLGDAQRSRLQSALAQQTGRHVELVETVDPDLIGGAVAKVGGVVFDSSLRTQLSQLRDTLTRG